MLSTILYYVDYIIAMNNTTALDFTTALDYTTIVNFSAADHTTIMNHSTVMDHFITVAHITTVNIIAMDLIAMNHTIALDPLNTTLLLKSKAGNGSKKACGLHG